MKNARQRIVFLTCMALGWFQQSSAQSTRELFSRPGLSLGAFHENFFDGSGSTSYRYAGDTILCGDTLVVLEHLTSTKSKVGLKFEGGQVRIAYLQTPCQLGAYYYNFDLQVGQVFDAGPFGGNYLTVVETGQKTLLNGEARRFLRLTNDPFLTWNIEWIEGIGDVTNGLFPAFSDFEGYDQFVCARDSSGDLWSSAISSDSLCDSLLCPVPILGFSKTISEKKVRFVNSTTDAYEWFWDFGDGQFSNEEHPEHEYDAPGCYEVCLNARTPCLMRSFKFCQPVPICVDPGWEVLNAPSFPPNAIIYEITFPTPDTGWIKGDKKFWKTLDGGFTWEEQFLPAIPPSTTLSLYSLYMANTTLGILTCGASGGSALDKMVFITIDGQNWLPCLPGIGSKVTEAVILPSGKGFATRYDAGLNVTLDFGQTWIEKALPIAQLQGFIHPTSLLPINEDTLYLLGSFESFQDGNKYPFLMRTYNDGDTWDFTLLPGTRIFHGGFFFNSQNGWLAGGMGYFLHTLDGGYTWQEVPFHESTYVTAVDFFDSKNGWAMGGNGLVLHTKDGGQSWGRENCGRNETMYAIAARDTNQAYITTNLFHLLHFAPSNEPLCIPSAIKETINEKKHQLHISPNPANTEIEIKQDGDAINREATIFIFNQLGQIVLKSAGTDGMKAIPVSNLPPGIYAVYLWREGSACASGRFVVGR